MRSGRHRRGFIFFYGWRTIERGDGRPPVQMTCPACREPARLRGRVRQRWFTLFFIPVAPLEAVDDGARFSQCTSCKRTFAQPIESFARRAGAGNDHQAAIRLYNDLRERPDDSATLLKMLTIYASLGEFGEAESSCRAFPAAFAGDPRCAELLAQMRWQPRA